MPHTEWNIQNLIIRLGLSVHREFVYQEESYLLIDSTIYNAKDL